jgi:uncharacterized coiled-coil DUF342 family protein
MTLIKTEVEGIFRDINNNALLNKDNGSLEVYKKMKKKNNEIYNLREEVDDMKKDMSEIKSLLTQIVEKL